MYDELESHETAEVSELTQKAMATLRTVSHCQGFNIGMNQGTVAGAGVAGHLHQHIVPRWANDSNFMPIVAGTRVMPELIEQTRALLSEAWLS
jgi:ATP adenylyltransferase